MKWTAQAPANIALIKYMGKLDETQNIPANSSLSYALPNCLSLVELELYDGKNDVWRPLNSQILSSQAQIRFLNHLDFLKKQFLYSGAFIVRSENNFPTGCGLASSASSFAALTLCAVKALSELTHTKQPDLETIAQWSRCGSGSSCRSIITPWTLWNREKISAVNIPYENLIHHVVIVEKHEKNISSRVAHQRVKTSLLFENRSARAEQRLTLLISALQNKQWDDAFKICWQEFWDMHALFHTCDEPFSYMQPNSLDVLNTLKNYWETHDDGPLVTMDAGPNIHLLFRNDQNKIADQIKQQLMEKYDVL